MNLSASMNMMQRETSLTPAMNQTLVIQPTSSNFAIELYLLIVCYVPIHS
jgi:hypothetical protein